MPFLSFEAHTQTWQLEDNKKDRESSWLTYVRTRINTCRMMMGGWRTVGIGPVCTAQPLTSCRISVALLQLNPRWLFVWKNFRLYGVDQYLFASWANMRRTKHWAWIHKPSTQVYNVLINVIVPAGDDYRLATQPIGSGSDFAYVFFKKFYRV